MEKHNPIFFSFLLGFFFVLSLHASQVQAQKNESIISALYVFGDSTIDPGNNNGLLTLGKANFLPYGRDFEGGRPTGRFTNGNLCTDILSSLTGLPDILPAYLDPEFRGQKLLTGCSFGSAASGYADSTSLAMNALPLGIQVANFRLYQAQLSALVGPEESKRIINGALFAISTGTDDFTNNYYLNPVSRVSFSVEQFQDLLIESLHRFIQGVYLEGARKIAIIGLPPFGCLPSQITVHNVLQNTCVQEFNDVASSFNAKIVALANHLNSSFPGFRVAYLDIYNSLFDMIKYPTKYGFVEVRKGCCGTGLLEASILCNELIPACKDASKYIFWDSYHPTSGAYTIIANDLFQQALTQLL